MWQYTLAAGISSSCRHSEHGDHFSGRYVEKLLNVVNSLTLEYWTFRSAPAQNAGSLEYPPGTSPPAPNLPAVLSSSTLPRRPYLRKTRHETIETLREELQAIRDGIVTILTNLQALSDTLSVCEPTTQNAQHHNVSSTRRRMDEMDTSPNDSAADDQSGTAMTGNAFDHAIQQDATLSSGSGFPDEAASQRPPLQSLPPDATPFQYDNVNYSFPGPVNAGGPGPGFPGFDPSVSLVNPWPRPVLDPRRPDFQPMIPQYAPNMGVHPSAMPSSIAMHPQGYGMPPPHPSAPHMSNPAPGNMDQFTTWGPYSALTLRPPGNQHDRGTSGAHRRPYNNQRRGRRQQSRSAPPPKRLDNMNDGRPEPKEPSELSVKLDCKICMTQLIDTAVFPCGHAALCRWCADLQIPPDRLNSSKPVNCPVCRGPVERKDRIFFS